MAKKYGYDNAFAGATKLRKMARALYGEKGEKAERHVEKTLIPGRLGGYRSLQQKKDQDRKISLVHRYMSNRIDRRNR
jgi:hypothetical protein